MAELKRYRAMDKTEERFTLEQARQLDLVWLLEKMGHNPVSRRLNDTDWWYRSPLREERTASFHVDILSNQWYDFGFAVGGNPVDFLLRYYHCSIPEMLARLNGSFSTTQVFLVDNRASGRRERDKHALEVKEIRPIYSYPLKSYLHERSIPVAVADGYCKEVTYEIGGRSYYGIGFQNDQGGWEIRNKNFKQSSAPKEITTMSFGARSAHVFEGFMDFLSYRTLNPYEDPRSVDHVVLNGAGLFDRALPFLLRHERVHLWLDRDVTGMAYRNHALSLGSCFVDESGLYEKFKDLNEWLRCKGEVPRVQQNVGLKVG